ncbi:MAG: AMP-binding protein, partial [Desulfosalsimonadaceae bacterium]
MPAPAKTIIVYECKHRTGAGVPARIPDTEERIRKTGYAGFDKEYTGRKEILMSRTVNYEPLSPLHFEVYGPHSLCAWKEQWDDLSVEERAKIKARQGVPYVTTNYMDVVDTETMEPVPHDGETIGEIVMWGNNVMLGYHNKPEETETAFRGGMFHSGDLAVTHPDGYVEIKDRLKDIIISGGENISSVEVENVLYEHPDIL